MNHKHVLIVGGGLVGMSSALALQRDGCQVTVLDPLADHNRASYGNAGVISPGSIFPMASPAVWPALRRYLTNRDPALRIRYQDSMALLPWATRFLGAARLATYRRSAQALALLVKPAADYHRALARDLNTTDWLNETGWLRAYRSLDAFQHTQTERELLAECDINVDILNRDDIQALEPDLAPRFEKAQFFPGALSIAQPGRLLERAYTVFRQRQGHVVQGQASNIDQHDARVAITTTAGTIQADYVLLAAGAWSGQLARRLGYRIPLIGERGYHRIMTLPSGISLNRPVNDVQGAYVMAPQDGAVRLLSGVELAHADSPPNLSQMRAIEQDAMNAFKEPLRNGSKQHSSDNQQTIETWMGSRPSTPDSLPVLGQAERHNRIIFAFGHGHVGFSTAPHTGQIVADLIAGRTPPLSLEAFRPSRFQR